MVTPIGSDDIVSSLGATVIADNDPRPIMADKVIRQQTFSRISETEIDDDKRMQYMPLAERG